MVKYKMGDESSDASLNFDYVIQFVKYGFAGEEYCLEQVANIVLEYGDLLFKGGKPFIFSLAPFQFNSISIQLQFNFNFPM
jgi:hypothetical protein